VTNKVWQDTFGFSKDVSNLGIGRYHWGDDFTLLTWQGVSDLSNYFVVVSS